ncbi:unnamed protein product (macronuclear) [Paramecium tetraurelia]|uniref:Protein kinase domain-containing protein n=1 Tax=Paramecium tetraurelia TaxID=5888 RepID=A0C3T1_PARTE|nr:uncharacterized protein GSPATT00034927001 [Paramecium tetraurelia]CAK65448.1 unnamed protein product [Paramecium tetraurelia]|eukprot:XP_001432845.1 hypothetical protein (macronuclear) [Paramecium tetraurelia strain d4-2]
MKILNQILSEVKVQAIIFGYIINKIGERGQGIVLLGRHKVTKELTAFKIINQQSWSGWEMDGVPQEQLIMKAFDPKNIVKLHQSYVTQNQIEIEMIMEYLKGGLLLNYANLYVIIAKLPEGDAKLHSKQIVDAIAYCHENNIAHYDLKLENIMLNISFFQRNSFQYLKLDLNY